MAEEKVMPIAGRITLLAWPFAALLMLGGFAGRSAADPALAYSLFCGIGS